MPLIQVEDAVKEFRIKKRGTQRFHTLREFFRPEYEIKRAVDGMSFEIERGELVGYIGPNGAGKSTTLKMLTGILVPTRGKVLVEGYEPCKNRRKNALRMGAVFGQRSQLLWDLPVSDTLELYQKMYRIDEERYRRNASRYIEMLEIGGFIKQPARQLSLGQKMRANLALALLHDPDILYLDEPTIGLDVVAKDQVRKFIREVNRERQTTVILTTHDMMDIEQICDRLILIDGGKKLFDGTLDAFVAQNSNGYVVRAVFVREGIRISDPRLEEISRNGVEICFRVGAQGLPPGEAITWLAREYPLIDVGIRQTPIEDIVKAVYQRKVTL